MSVYGHPEEFGIATVELSGDLENLKLLLPDTAEQLANGILLAVRQARGEKIPTALDSFLKGLRP